MIYYEFMNEIFYKVKDFIILENKIISSNTNAGHIRQHDGFFVRDVGLFGMSGGPVFDANGVVVGMQAAVTNPRESKNADGRTIVVENAIIIRSDLILDLLKRNGIRANFLGRF